MFKKGVVIFTLLSVLALGFGTATAQDEQVELRLWMHQNPTFLEATQNLVDLYTADHPNVTITIETFDYDQFIQTLQTSMPSGTEGDIIQMFGTWVCSYALGGRLAPMPEEVMTTDEATELFFEAPLDGYTCGEDDTLYGLPQEFNIEYGAALVNPAMFEAAGLEYPPQWESWDDLVADAEQMTQYDDTGMMSVAGFHFTSADPLTFLFFSSILQMGGDYWNEDHTGLTINTPEAHQVAEWMLSMVEDHQVVDPVLFNDTTNWVGDAFFSGFVAIGPIGPWAVSMGLTDFPDFGEFGYVRLPHFGDEPVFVADSGWGLTVSPNSPYQDIAWDFVKFAAADAQNALDWSSVSGTIPAIRQAVEDEDMRARFLDALPWMETDLPLLPYGRYIGDLPDRDLVWYDIAYPHLLNMLQGIEDIDYALQAIEEESNATFE